MSTSATYQAYTLALIVFAFFSTAQIAGADNAYSWKDSSGRVVFGSRPPRNARGLKKLNTPTLSRYSSDKVLKRLGHTPEKSPWKNTRARMDKKSSAPKPHEENLSFIAAELEHGEVSVQSDEKARITSCVVRVKNIGTNEARDISVAFEFADGSLVPGVGPGTLSANSEGEYSLPQELLPLKLKTNQEAELIAAPLVRVHGFTD